MKKRRRGFLGMEILLTATMLVLLAGIAVNALDFSFLVSADVKDETELQDGFRHASDLMVNSIRDATGIFVMPESSFNYENLNDDDYLDDGWNYVGIVSHEKDGKTVSEIVQYIYDDVEKEHRKKILLTSTDIYYFDLTITKNYDSSQERFIEFVLDSYLQQDDSVYMDVEAQIEALSSLQVISWSSVSTLDPGKAIAYRTADREYDDSAVVRVVMALDCSGSMTELLQNPGSASKQRVVAMKEAAVGMVNELADSEYIDIIIMPFSSSTNFGKYSWSDTQGVPDYNTRALYGNAATDFYFLNVQDNLNKLRNYINSFVATGGTNVADSFRRAKYAFSIAEEAHGKADLEVFIHLSDGDATFYPIVQQNNYDSYGNSVAQNVLYDFNNTPFFDEPGDIGTAASSTINSKYMQYYYKIDSNGEYYPTVFSSSSITQGKNYALGGMGNNTCKRTKESIQYFGNQLADRPKLKSYVIGLSNDISSENLENMKTGLDAEKVYRATNYQELLDVFTEIGQSVLEDTWFIHGPKKLPE